MESLIANVIPSTRRDWLRATSLAAASALLPSTCRPAAGRTPHFELSFPATLRAEPFTGRVYVFFSRGQAEPRTAGDWFAPQPILARDVINLRPGDVVALSPDDPDVMTYPRDLTAQDLTGLRAQGLMRFNPWERTVGAGPGNGCSDVRDVAGEGAVPLAINQVLPQRPDPESRWSRVFETPSKLLSEFHGRPVAVRGMVSLPASWYDDAARRYPTMFEVPGFSGTLRLGFREQPVNETNDLGVEFLRVTLDPNCPLGHHVFADSANNGPWGRALVEEYLPAFEREFRTVAEPRGRVLTGHSSGGWSSLWLQVSHPDVFGGTWSTAPDPVDFRDFQRINLYRPGENMFADDDGERRPIARRNGQPVLWFDDFCRREDVLGPGGQLHSFEAVFSPRGDDGRPRLLWDRDSGAIDPQVAAAWTAYDIRLVLEDHWDTLGPRLRGKLHVHMGDEDTFYLDGATRLLKEALQALGSDAIVEMHAGKDHNTLMTRDLRDRIRQEMAQRVLQKD